MLNVLSVFAETDTQIQDELDKMNQNNLQQDFSLQSFRSCEDMETVLNDHWQSYVEEQKKAFRGGSFRNFVMEESFMEMDASSMQLEGVSA